MVIRLRDERARVFVVESGASRDVPKALLNQVEVIRLNRLRDNIEVHTSRADS